MADICLNTHGWVIITKKEMRRGCGANINARCEGKWRLGFTPLHVASYFGRKSIIKILLKNNADPTVINDNGETAYALAIIQGHQESADLLK